MLILIRNLFTWQVLGPEHPAVAVTLVNMAQLYSRTQEHLKAQQSAKRAIQIYDDVYGIDHFDYAAAINTLAGMLAELDS